MLAPHEPFHGSAYLDPSLPEWAQGAAKAAYALLRTRLNETLSPERHPTQVDIKMVEQGERLSFRLSRRVATDTRERVVSYYPTAKDHVRHALHRALPRLLARFVKPYRIATATLRGRRLYLLLNPRPDAVTTRLHTRSAVGDETLYLTTEKIEMYGQSLSRSEYEAAYAPQALLAVFVERVLVEMWAQSLTQQPVTPLSHEYASFDNAWQAWWSGVVRGKRPAVTRSITMAPPAAPTGYDESATVAQVSYRITTEHVQPKRDKPRRGPLSPA